jgi:predicted HAD superfamily Cof-like phosphohydrolase
MFMKESREQKVGKFLKAAGKSPFESAETYDISHENNLDEEVTELILAMRDYQANPNEENRANLCKEWADVQVVLSNVAWYFDIPADVAFNRVHNNNMTKVVDGKVILREDGKILKPEGYVKPDMRGI